MRQRNKEQKSEAVKLKHKNWRCRTNGTLWRVVWEEPFPEFFILCAGGYATHPENALGLDQAPLCKDQHYIRQLPFLAHTEPAHTQPASERSMDLVWLQADLKMISTGFNVWKQPYRTKVEMPVIHLRMLRMEQWLCQAQRTR